MDDRALPARSPLRRRLLPGALALLLATLVARPAAAAETPVELFLRLYNSLYTDLSRVSGQIGWLASTDATAEHDAGRAAANTALAAFAGNRLVIESTRRFLAQPALSPIERRALGKILLAAAEGPGTIPDVTAARVAAESRQTGLLDSFVFHLAGRPVTPNDLDEVLHGSADLTARLAAWEASKEIGKTLKPGIVELQRLRNEVAREMGHSGYFALQVADYDMSDAEMMKLLDSFVADTKPLFKKLHAYARMKLAERYHQPIPKLIPAHWISNRWAQSWDGIAEGAVDLDPLFKDKSPEWVAKTAERFYTSMGFAPLPKSFWEKSDLYALPATDKRHKNAHAFAYHIDLDKDVRSLQSIKPNSYWFYTAHHELGHIYYYMAYTRPEVPPILRAGANRAMHEAVGDLAAIAAKQPRYLEAIGVLPKGQVIDEKKELLSEAITSGLTVIAWAAGTMPHFEHDLYEKKLPPAEWQRRWWQYVAEFQGVAPPSPRPNDGCDACTKTHINDIPANYYQYGIAAAIKYQLHEHICRKILKTDPHSCSYYGHKEVGDYLKSILQKGATEPFNQVMVEATGAPLSIRALLDYYRPLEGWLDAELKGKPVGW